MTMENNIQAKKISERNMNVASNVKDETVKK